MENTKRLDEAIRRTLLKLDALEPADPGYTPLTDRLSKLYALRTEEEKAAEDTKNKEKELSQQQKAFWVRTAIDAGIAIGTAGIYLLCVRWGYRFEEHGTVSSATFKRIQNEGKLKRLG